MRVSWRTEWPHWLLLVVSFVIAAYGWMQAPERVPLHWSISGDVDRFGGPESLFFMPLIALGVYLLLRFAPKIDPFRANYESFIGTYDTLRLVILAFLTALGAVVTLAALNEGIDVNTLVLLMMGVLFMILGNYLGKLRPNFFIGIRTPWTLTSKRAWIKTHRLAGWLMILMGFALVLAALVWPGQGVGSVAVFAAVTAIVLMAYSYLVWRDDPDRSAPGAFRV